MPNQWAQDFALRLAPVAAGVANFCDHVEHNERADRAWVIDAGAYLRVLACDQAVAAGFSPIQLYAERLGDIEARNVLAHPGSYDGHGPRWTPGPGVSCNSSRWSTIVTTTRT